MLVSEVSLLRQAIEDLNSGQEFYNRRELGVGNYFWESLSIDIQSLYTYGGIHQKDFGVHRMLAKRFPYAIYYEYSEPKVQVIAILPIKRSPIFIEKAISHRT